MPRIYDESKRPRFNDVAALSPHQRQALEAAQRLLETATSVSVEDVRRVLGKKRNQAPGIASSLRAVARRGHLRCTCTGFESITSPAAPTPPPPTDSFIRPIPLARLMGRRA